MNVITTNINAPEFMVSDCVENDRPDTRHLSRCALRTPPQYRPYRNRNQSDDRHSISIPITIPKSPNAISLLYDGYLTLNLQYAKQ